MQEINLEVGALGRLSLMLGKAGEHRARAFAKEELGWWDGHVYKSGMDGNVWTPGTAGAPWELVR